jgi:hypothetical protein
LPGWNMRYTSLSKLAFTIATTRWHRLKLSLRRLVKSWTGV